MGRIAHYLEPNKKTRVPANFIFFDTETFQRQSEKVRMGKNDVELYKHELKLGVAIYRRFDRNVRKVLYFKTKDEFWDFVIKHVRRGIKLYLVAHNIFFDFSVLDGYNELKKRGFELKKRKFKDYDNGKLVWKEKRMLIFRNRIFYAEFTNGSSTIALLNLGNIFNFSLKKIGKAIGLEKLEVDFDNVSEEELFRYCYRDAEIVEKAMEGYLNFIKEEDLGEFAFTISSQAMKAYRHRFMKYRIHIHADEEAMKLEREAYHGGRSECFYIGKWNKGMYYVDVNSLYPFVMKYYKYPVQLLSVVKPKDDGVQLLKEIIDKGYLVVAKVFVEIDKNILPKKKDRLLAPVGKFWTVLSTPEVRLAFAYGKILKVEKIAVYRGRRIFEDYVDYFYSKKMNSTGMYKAFYKLFLNSLYGKWGQKNPNWIYMGKAEDDGVSMDIIFEGDRRRYIRKFWGIYEMSVGEGDDSWNSFVAIASHVTAYAWTYMTLIREKLGYENVLYMDTDSFFLTREGYKKLQKLNLLDNKQLGKFKFEGFYPVVVIRAPKDYVLLDENEEVIEEKIKGVGKNGIRIGDNLYKVLIFPSPAGLIRLHKKVQGGGYYTYYQIKELQRDYKKGIVLDNGRVVPLKEVESLGGQGFG